MARCIICGDGPEDGHTALIRINDKGRKGIWVCTKHGLGTVETHEEFARRWREILEVPRIN